MTEINNNETEPEEVLITCTITGDDYPEDEMQQVPESSYGVMCIARRSRWIGANPDVPVDQCPWEIPTMVWIRADIAHAYCEDCGVIHDMDDPDCINDGFANMCPNCAQNYSWCHDHDRWNHVDEGCDYCCNDDDDYDGYGSSLIHDYSYRPYPTFFICKKGEVTRDSYEPAKTAVTGFELEMEAHTADIGEAARIANDLFGSTTYLKHDGSLDSGFEMVSHPMTLEYLNDKFNFKDLRSLSQLGMRSAQTSTCGLHVHINKGYFDGIATSAYRFMSMFYANAEQWQRLAGRTRSSYAQWDLNEMNQMLSYTRNMKNRDAYRFNGDRYVAVNLQPSKTIELRFFKGTLRPETLHARLQAVHAVAEFAVASRNTINIKKSSNWDEFRSWTEANAERFGVFNTYANERGV